MKKSIANYTLQRTIDNSGATCKVKQAVDKKSGKAVAIKLIRTDLAKKMKEFYQAELEALTKIPAHPNVIKLIDH